MAMVRLPSASASAPGGAFGNVCGALDAVDDETLTQLHDLALLVDHEHHLVERGALHRRALAHAMPACTRRRRRCAAIPAR